MDGYEVKFCNHCQHSIIVGQRWVREKIYDPRFTDQDAAYRHFHAEPLEGQEVSCWESHWIEREIAQPQ
jgi:NMD protein affecting ribosome stability and mRNA decay